MLRNAYAYIVLCLMSCTMILFADEPIPVNEEELCCPSEELNCLAPPLLELKVGYFFFAESRMRSVYDSGGVDVQIASSYPVWKWLQIYGSAGIILCNGKSLFGREKTTIYELPLSLGLRPVVVITEKIHYYLAIGPRYTFVFQNNHSNFVDHHIHQSGLGGFANTGFNFFPYPHLVIDIFGEYFYSKMHFHSSRTGVFGRGEQVGGFTFGGGIGYAF